MKWPAFLAVLVAWSVLAWLFIFVFAGTHVCGILRPVGEGTGQVVLSAEEWAALTAAQCNRPDVGAILVFGAGYIVLAGVAIRMLHARRSAL